ncbi:hypothetical protein F3157_11205 [Virgibacillus dakarensis]|uniref:hypothetical protein n=1 Tax=Virgibacillus dakarensis TaxID=1917889 RepID=UPI000B43B40B|nr:MULTISPECIES: hypothetical protein [Bacillaceae]MBT2215491.1 hypothetical protein [Virgibacillus dakarensis]MTW86220.1 hypothetical protein [Virgibacillus dakarensis]
MERRIYLSLFTPISGTDENKKSITSQIEKEKQKWEKDKEKLEKKDFSCERDAKLALSEFHRGAHMIERYVASETRAGKRKKTGTSQKRRNHATISDGLYRKTGHSSTIRRTIGTTT